MRRALCFGLALSLVSISCGSGGSPAADDDDTPDSGPGDGDGDGGDAGGGPCAPGTRGCAGIDRQWECQVVAGAPTRVETACGAYAYCTADRCEPGCLDECALGETRTNGGATQVCGLYAESSGGFVTPGDGMHDLARRHLAWIRAHHLANGYIANTLFTSQAYTAHAAYTGTVDAAEWTGVYLAAEALRARTTRSPDAIRGVEATIERIYQLFDITGQPGYMARIWAPLGGDPLLAALYDPADTSHFTTTFGGGPAFFHAWTSRDMYAGVALGLALAYDATTSEGHRAMVRTIAVDLARELVRDRVDVPVRLRYHLLGSWQTMDTTYDLRHVVLVPDEMVDGRIYIQVGSTDDPSDYGASELRGAREFVPDMRTVLGQTPGLGPLVPAIPRPGSALMLASFMELALHVTEGVPGFDADRAAIRAHYDAERSAWLAVMKQYAYHNEENCWTQYFGLTIAHHPLYALLHLTDDAAFAQELRSGVLAARMRPFVVDHHNPYFDYAAAGEGPAGLVPAAELAATTSQLAGFVAPPKAARPVDNRGAYPANASCPGQSTMAVSIADRVPQDFLWQHHPFRLTNEFVHREHVYPGTDYLIGYWLGRYHELVADDRPGTCTRWRT
ncbi:MAG: hypothetical protein F9K40_16265 [Kofleriaceae bacterium]|nr:MAG: hypothetical protein F9K40_16265 [Kofleriaceae bacterium]MBZ0237352.1 hypothetical protein [Kofleriaceae bacterium]